MKFKTYLIKIVFTGSILWVAPTGVWAAEPLKVSTSLVVCTDSGDDFYGDVSVDSYASDANSVCTGQVTADGVGYSFEFQPYSGGSSYGASAINASMQTACKVLEEAQNVNLEVRVLGDIYDCSLRGGSGSVINKKIKAEYIVIGDDDSLSYTNAFVGSARGDAVAEADSSVEEYLVYSNQADNHCSPSLLTSDGEDFNGLIMNRGRRVGYAVAIMRCNALLEAYLNDQTVDITGEIYNAPSSAESGGKAAVTITGVR